MKEKLNLKGPAALVVTLSAGALVGGCCLIYGCGTWYMLMIILAYALSHNPPH